MNKEMVETVKIKAFFYNLGKKLKEFFYSLGDKLKNVNWRSPYLWVGIAFFVLIVILLIVLLVIPKAKEPALSCKDKEILHDCSGKSICGPKCVFPFTFDCKTKKCGCPEGTTICEKGSICCKDCKNDLCCSEDMQYYVDPNDPSKGLKCCDPGTIATPDKKGCTVVCGFGEHANACNSGQKCVQISGLSDTQLKEWEDTIIFCYW